MHVPVIEFKEYEIKKFRYTKKDETNLNDNAEPFEISVSPGITDDYLSGRIVVEVILTNDEIDVELIVNGYFTVNIDEIEDKEKINQYLIVNGTAILFPYIRGMVSMLTSLDNKNAIILPTINTHSLLSEQEN